MYVECIGGPRRGKGEVVEGGWVAKHTGQCSLQEDKLRALREGPKSMEDGKDALHSTRLGARNRLE